MIPRGDLQATFVFKGFDEVQRLGLTHATEAAVRAASREAAQSGETACRHVHQPSAQGSGQLPHEVSVTMVM